MKPFDYNKYLKNNPLLRENINAGGIEAPLMTMLKGQSDDMSFLDGVSDQEFMATLKNMGIKYKTFDNDGEMNYYIGKAGNGMIFVNSDGDWMADDWARP